ncbi:alpha-E domain-containing protein [Polymorphum gilvum]|uniref:Conserved domain protein n=1 Tax=Polymorphum gilvum (strain LMG 25793 / CGMCC 1.9160 / SL003B-26A1) TaxID=991905 RepID=F2IUX8_POLGS|nr:alpha-E domain-containing protein [Polymorphum gilvum]ADZ70207.1 Conserved domain protein [Polymorphum gilvum SL003B-26A1]
MLGRTAASLFWMSRYQERSQNTARLLEVAYRIAMVPHTGADETEDWRNALACAGCEAGFRAKGGEVTPRTVINYMIFDKDNPSSVRTCLEMARNNARSVRTGITSDMWESLNTTWIEFSDVKPQALTHDRLPEFLAWVGQRAQQFRGALLGTILRDDGYYFSQLGHFVERADHTARVLDTRYWILLPDNDVGGTGHRYQWSSLLRALSGLRSYRFAYPDAQLKAFNVAEFLILRKEMPRSLAYCYDWINGTMDDLTNYYGERMPSADLAAAIWSQLRDGQMRDIYSAGLHDFLVDFAARNNAFSVRLAQDYNFA